MDKVTCDVCGGPTFMPAVGQPESNHLVYLKCDEKPDKHCHTWGTYAMPDEA